MQSLVCMPLEGGGTILFEAGDGAGLEFDGPVKAGRVAEAVRELPQTLQDSLVPVRETARTVLEQLRQVGPDEVEVEFGVNLSAQAGAVISKGAGAVHLKVRVLWKAAEPETGTR
jgi:hypothetical protein